MVIKEEQVNHEWKPTCGNYSCSEVTVSPSYYSTEGTPQCECGYDMEYESTWITQDLIDEISGSNIKPMWIVFVSRVEADDNGCNITDSDGGPRLVDEYFVVESMEKAQERYGKELSKTNCNHWHCGGFAPIEFGSEPQWIDGGV